MAVKSTEHETPLPLMPEQDTGVIRKFATGATRDTATNKYDYEAFLSPLVIERYGEFMHKHRKQTDGTLRDGDNWQKGIPLSAYMKSTFRHFIDLWKWHRAGVEPADGSGWEDAACAIIFNVSGYLHEHLKARKYGENRP